VRKENGSYVLTDDGYTVNDLLNSGVRLDSPKRQDLFKVTLNGYGIQSEGDALIVHGDERQFCRSQAQSIAGDVGGQ